MLGDVSELDQTPANQGIARLPAGPAHLRGVTIELPRGHELACADRWPAVGLRRRLSSKAGLRCGHPRMNHGKHVLRTVSDKRKRPGPRAGEARSPGHSLFP